MTRIYTPIFIPVPVELAFDYVSTPANWPQWHPSSLSVSGATDHSLEPGEQVTEEFLVAGRRGQVTWTVRERVFPHRWVIEGEIAGSESGGVVSYTFSNRENGTFFEREFTYKIAKPLRVLLDRLVIRRRIEGESWQAVRQLHRVLLQRSSEKTGTTVIE